MGNTNFQTIHQMGTAISDFVKQATGRDNVQNIDMDHITVAQNHRYEEVDVSGRAVSFQAGEAGIPFEKMLVQIAPVQDLHGYDHPWPGGGGDCVLRQYEEAPEIEGLTISVDNGKITINGTALTTTTIDAPVTGWQWDGTSDYWLSGCPAGGDAFSGYSLRVDGTNSAYSKYDTGNGVKLEAYNNSIIGVDLRFRIVLRSGTYSDLTFAPMLNAGLSAKPYSPYSNICPITGWTMVNVYQSGQNMEDARVYRFPFPSEAGAVYGGTLDVVTGELVVDRFRVNPTAWERYAESNGYVAYRSQGIPVAKFVSAVSNEPMSNMISKFGSFNSASMDRNIIQLPTSTIGQAFMALTNTIDPTVTPVELTYLIKTPIIYQLTPQEITTLLGQNYIWADTGDIEVKFTNVKELY